VDIVLSLMASFILGIGACWVFWRWQLRVKPKVRLADRAVFCTASKWLGVKVANVGKHQVTDVEARLAIAERTKEERIIIRKIGILNAPTLFAIEPLSKLHEPWLLPTVFVFAARNGEEMVQCLTDDRQAGADRRLLFTLSMRDGVSGTKVVKTAVFKPAEIEIGWYEPSLSFKTNPGLCYEPSIEANYDAISQVPWPSAHNQAAPADG
jgi:hypothetical protein